MDPLSGDVDATARRFATAVFGDRVGLMLFVGTMVFFGLTWRVDFFITDSLTVANTLVNVADGHLYVDEILYRRGASTAATPGMHVVDGRLYGRNYGHVFLALPVLWLLGAVAAVADPAIAILGAWSLLLLALCDQAGAETGHREQFATVGVVVALATFGVNVALAQPLDPRWFPLMALQLSTMVAAALGSVVLYRLLAAMHDRRTGVFAGAGVALATPVGVWATIPKRHTITAALALFAVYSFYRSRAAPSESAALRFRALTYVWTGLTAWVHAPEGAVLFAALAAVDLPTARTNRPEHLAVVGVVFAVSTLPLLATNQLLSGDPLAVPRMLPDYRGQEPIVGLDTTVEGPAVEPAAGETEGIGNSGEPDPSGGGDPSDGAEPSRPLLGPLNAVFGLLSMFVAQLVDGVDAISRPEALGRTFVRRGNPEYWHGRGNPINLALLESIPLAALLAFVPLTLYRWDRRKLSRYYRWDPGWHELSTPASITPERATDLLALTYVSILVLVYVPRLPVHASITVRYLHPLYPLVVYFVARQAPVRSVLAERQRLLVWSYAGSVLIGGQLLVVVLASLVSTPGEAIQFHGLLALAAAGLLVAWVTVAGVRGGYERTGAVLVALAGAVTTLFVLLSTYVYFGFMNRPALPSARVVSEALSFV